MANPTTYFGWVMPTSSSLVTNLPADFNTFGQGVDTSLQDLLGGTTGQVLSKTSNTNMDFTWVTPTDQTPLTTKGDLFTFSTVDARLAVGTNGQTLVADSSTATGLKWAAANAPANFSLLGSASLSGSTTTISGISGMNQLYVLINSASVTGGGALLRLRINTDTGANYDDAFGYVAGATSWAAGNVGANGNFGGTSCLMSLTANTGASAYFGGAMINGCNTTGNKMIQWAGGNTAAGGNGQYFLSGVGRYTGTSTVSSVSLNTDSTFDGGTIYVYGSA